MSATTRRAKAAELHAENERLRIERNAMIGTNAELIKEIDILRGWLQSETEWANHYHAEGLALREELDAMATYANQLQRENDALVEKVQKWEEIRV